MSLLAPALARRVDRLARHAHRFHRWAHHPLCHRYATDVIRLGRRTRLCRGCTFAVSGGLLGLAAGLVAPPGGGLFWLVATSLLLVAVPLAIPGERMGPSRARRRIPKLLTRLAPAALSGGALGEALSAPSPLRLAAAVLGAAAMAFALLRYRRHGPNRAACGDCPEAPLGPRCAGFAPMMRRERALSRLAGRWIAEAMPGPPTAATGPGPRPTPPAPPATPPTPLAMPRPS